MYDELTGHELDKEEVLKARMNEIDGLANIGVWDIAPRAHKGHCWVDINKGDDKKKVYRSRYVAMEMRKMHGGNAREELFRVDAFCRGA